MWDCTVVTSLTRWGTQQPANTQYCRHVFFLYVFLQYERSASAQNAAWTDDCEWWLVPNLQCEATLREHADMSATCKSGFNNATVTGLARDYVEQEDIDSMAVGRQV